MNGASCNFAHGERDLHLKNMYKGKKKSQQQQNFGYADMLGSRAHGGQINSPRPPSSTTGGTSDSSPDSSETLSVPLSAPPGLVRPSSTCHLPWKVPPCADESLAKYASDLEILKLCAARIAMRIKMEEEEQQARIREDLGLLAAHYISTRGLIA